MASFVTIASVGPRPAVGPDDVGADVVLGRVSEYWRTKFDLVLHNQPDIVVTPENCDPHPKDTEGEASYRELRGDKLRDVFADMAQEHNCYVLYSDVREIDEGVWGACTQVIDRSGKVVAIYAKNRALLGDTSTSDPDGNPAPLIKCDFGTLGCALSFDLSFEELSSRYGAEKPDVFVFSSIMHGGRMHNYWATSARTHFVGTVAGTYPCNIISPTGEIIATSANYFDHVLASVNLDCCKVHLDHHGGPLKALEEKYGGDVIVSNPGYLGAVLVSSETKAATVQQMLEEFGINALGEDWDRAMAHRSRRAE